MPHLLWQEFFGDLPSAVAMLALFLILRQHSRLLLTLSFTSGHMVLTLHSLVSPLALLFPTVSKVVILSYVLPSSDAYSMFFFPQLWLPFPLLSNSQICISPFYPHLTIPVICYHLKQLVLNLWGSSPPSKQFCLPTSIFLRITPNILSSCFKILASNLTPLFPPSPARNKNAVIPLQCTQPHLA